MGRLGLGPRAGQVSSHMGPAAQSCAAFPVPLGPHPQPGGLHTLGTGSECLAQGLLRAGQPGPPFPACKWGHSRPPQPGCAFPCSTARAGPPSLMRRAPGGLGRGPSVCSATPPFSSAVPAVIFPSTQVLF